LEYIHTNKGNDNTWETNDIYPIPPLI
jgi:hypothetical protein